MSAYPPYAWCAQHTDFHHCPSQTSYRGTDGPCYCGRMVTEIEPNVWVDDTDSAKCGNGAWHIPMSVPS